jgi:TonB family protein
MQERALFDGSFLDQPPLIKRLFNEFQEGSHEFRQNPKAYFAAAFKDDSAGARRRRELFRFGMAVGVTVFSTVFFLIVILPQFNLFGEAKAEAEQEELVMRAMVDTGEIPEIEAPKADKRAGGGGGGGRQETRPASKGELPRPTMSPQLIAPSPYEPLKPPKLAVEETIQVPPELMPKWKDTAMPTGLPSGLDGPPSSGTGTGGGIGDGKGTGIGPGTGGGVGPGEGGGMGGGKFGDGGGDGVDTSGPPDVKPRQLNNVRPNYTEDARRNKIQGTVLARIVIGADGTVKRVTIVRGLPDGLNEEAIQAVYKLRFSPAMKNGRPIPYTMKLEVAFSLR